MKIFADCANATRRRRHGHNREVKAGDSATGTVPFSQSYDVYVATLVSEFRYEWSAKRADVPPSPAASVLCTFFSTVEGQSQ